MTIAEIHGKISPAGTNLSERMEDLLTSDVFGCMRYLPPQKALIPFLSAARSLHGNSLVIPDKTTATHYSFWPWLKLPGRIPCEPDVVVGLEAEDSQVHLIMAEAKYYSGLSSEEDERIEPNDQLARELDNLDALSCAALGWKPNLDISTRALLFVTQDMGMPRDLLAQSLGEYRRKRRKEGDIFWVSWRALPSILEQSLKIESIPEHTAVLKDMLTLLLRKDLRMFGGVEPVTKYLDLPVFYRLIPSKYSWLDIPELIDIDYTYREVR